jgi:hypothetical protein
MEMRRYQSGIEKGFGYNDNGEIFWSSVGTKRSEFSLLQVSKQNLRSGSEAGSMDIVHGSVTAAFGYDR